MGVRKELHIEMMNLEVQWQDLVAEILGQSSVGRALRMKSKALHDFFRT